MMLYHKSIITRNHSKPESKQKNRVFFFLKTHLKIELQQWKKISILENEQFQVRIKIESTNDIHEIPKRVVEVGKKLRKSSA